MSNREKRLYLAWNAVRLCYKPVLGTVLITHNSLASTRQQPRLIRLSSGNNCRYICAHCCHRFRSVPARDLQEYGNLTIRIFCPSPFCYGDQYCVGIYRPDATTGIPLFSNGSIKEHREITAESVLKKKRQLNAHKIVTFLKGFSPAVQGIDKQPTGLN